MRAVTSAAAQSQVLAAFAYDPMFASGRLPALGGVLALNILLHVIVAVHGAGALRAGGPTSCTGWRSSRR
jgi:hypothetical protein